MKVITPAWHWMNRTRHPCRRGQYVGKVHFKKHPTRAGQTDLYYHKCESCTH